MVNSRTGLTAENLGREREGISTRQSGRSAFAGPTGRTTHFLRRGGLSIIPRILSAFFR